MTVIIHHNPRCSKSRAALALIEERGIEPEVVHYLETPPDAERLRELAGMLGVRAAELVRTGESAWKELGVDVQRADDEELFRLMAEHPILIQRPIVVAGGRACIGRPPERVLDILQAGANR